MISLALAVYRYNYCCVEKYTGILQWECNTNEEKSIMMQNMRGALESYVCMTMIMMTTSSVKVVTACCSIISRVVVSSDCVVA